MKHTDLNYGACVLILDGWAIYLEFTEGTVGITWPIASLNEHVMWDAICACEQLRAEYLGLTTND